MHGNAGVAGAELHQQLRNMADAIHGRHTDADLAAVQLVQVLQFPPCALQAQQAGFGARQKQQALGRDADLPRGPVEQGHTQLILQPTHRHAQRRLRHMQYLGGLGEAALAGDFDAILQGFEVHKMLA